MTGGKAKRLPRIYPAMEFTEHPGRREATLRAYHPDGWEVGKLVLQRWERRKGRVGPDAWYDNHPYDDEWRACKRGVRKSLAAFARRGIDPATVSLWHVTVASSRLLNQGIGLALYEEALVQLQGCERDLGPAILTANICTPSMHTATSDYAKRVWEALARRYVGGPYAVSPFPRRRRAVEVAIDFGHRLVARQQRTRPPSWRARELAQAGGWSEVTDYDGDWSSIAVFGDLLQELEYEYGLLGCGASRCVVPAPGGLVIKLPVTTDGMSDNVAEGQRWQDALAATAKHLAPLEYADENMVVMRRAKPFDNWNQWDHTARSAMWKIEDDPAFQHMHDLDSVDNWGTIGGKPVLLDYGYMR